MKRKTISFLIAGMMAVQLCMPVMAANESSTETEIANVKTEGADVETGENETTEEIVSDTKKEVPSESNIISETSEVVETENTDPSNEAADTETNADKTVLANEDEDQNVNSDGSETGEIYSGDNVPESSDIAEKYTNEYKYDITSKATTEEKDGKTVPSQEELQNALNAANFIRYTAGLKPITLDEYYTELAQAGAELNAAGHKIDHTPEKPEGYDEDAYTKGLKGTSHSNLGQGYFNLAMSIIGGYMNDGDKNNISRLGHRRWVLDPDLTKTGFGQAEGTDTNGNLVNFAAMYVIDAASNDTVVDYVAWPAKNMPIELMIDGNGKADNSYPWSVSLGEKYDTTNLSGAKVTLSNGTNTWTFNAETSNMNGNYFGTDTVSEDGRHIGQGNVIIFRPDPSTINYKPGDKFTVSIEGISDKDGNPTSLSYEVNMFKAADGGNQNPEDPPKDDGDKPGKPGTTPDKPGTTPGKPGTTPGKPGTTPDKPGTTPDKPGTTPDKPGTTPDNPSTTPDNPSGKPGVGNPSGDNPIDNSTGNITDNPAGNVSDSNGIISNGNGEDLNIVPTFETTASTNRANANSSKTHAPKTGDNTVSMVYVVLMLAALGMIAMNPSLRRKTK